MPEPVELFSRVMELVAQPSWEACRDQVVGDSGVVSPAAGAILDMFIVAARNGNARDRGRLVGGLERLRRALLRIPEVGAEHAFAEAGQDRWDYDVADLLPPDFTLLVRFWVFVGADTWEESRRFLEQHPELLDPALDAAVDRLLGGINSDNGDDSDGKPEQAISRLRQHQALLRRCREIGVEAAFAEIPSPPLPDPMLAALDRFLGAETPQDAKQRLEEHPKLVTEEGVARLGQVIAQLAPSIPDEAILTLGTRLVLLRRCVEAGVEAAFEEASGGQPHESELLKQLLECLRSAGQSGTAQIIGDHPELVHDDTGEVFATLRATAEGGGDPHLAAAMDEFMEFHDQAQRFAGIPADLSVLPALAAFVGADSWDESRRVVAEHPELLDGAADRALAGLEREAQAAGQDEFVEIIRVHRRLLERCRAVGVSRAFVELGLLGEESSADETAVLERLEEMSEAGAPEDVQVRIRAQEAAHLFDRHRADGNRADLDAAIRCAEEVTRIADADDEFSPYYLDFLGQLLTRRYSLKQQLKNLTGAVDAHRQAVAASPEGSERARLATSLGHALADLHARTEDPEHLEGAIGAYRTAVEAVGPDAAEHHAGLLANLGQALQTRFARSADLADLTEVIDVLRRGIRAATPDHPLWFDLRNNLGVNLVTRFDRVRDVTDLDEAIAGYDETVPRLHDQPGELSLHLLGRGSAWRGHYQLDHAQTSIDRAIADYRAAADAAPDLPTLAHHLAALANALIDRFRLTGHRPDLDEAISSYQRAVTCHRPDYEQRAGLLTALANALAERWETAEAGEVTDLEAAVRTQEEAVAQTPPGSDEWPGNLSTLGTRYLDRYEHSGDPTDLDTAITHHHAAVQTTPADSPELPAQLGNWATSLLARYRQRGNPDDLDQAITANTRAVQATSQTSQNYAAHLTNWAFSLMARYRRDTNLTDLDAANDALKRANQAPTDADTPADTVTSTGLAGTLLARYDNTRITTDLDEAIQLLNPDRQRISRSAHLRRRAGLANALSERYRRDQDLRDLDQAIQLRREVLAQVPPQAPERVNRCASLGEDLLRRHDVTDDADTRQTMLAEVVTLCREAVELTADGSPDAPHHLVALAEGLRRAGDHDGATEHYRKACTLGLTVDPRGVLVTANLWGPWAANRTAWAEAGEAYQFGLKTLRRLVGSQASRTDKETLLRGTRDIATGLAHARAMTGDLQGAVSALEEGRAIILMEMLHDRHQPPARSPEPTSVATRPAAPSFAEIAETADPTPLVYLAAADTGGLALIVRGSEVQRVPLDALSDRALSDRTGIHMFIYSLFLQDPDRYREIWADALSTITAWLWSAAIGPVLDALGEAEEAVLVAGGLLGLLPLHAAWTTDAETTTGRRYALDQLTISYTPNAMSLQQARTLAAKVPAHKLLAVVEPQPVRASRLWWARAEEAGFAAGAGTALTSTSLAGEEATPENFHRDVVIASVLHMICHGSTDLLEPLDSHLLLAGDQQVRLRDLMAMRLQARLAVLSACETGLPGADLPDEVLALPTGLLQAGVAGVVASQWSVRDGATAMLMTEFARLWAGGAMPPAKALRLAQQWLRDTTDLEKQDHWLKTGLPDRIREMFECQFKRSQSAEPFHRRSHDSIDVWAAFTYVGAP